MKRDQVILEINKILTPGLLHKAYLKDDMANGVQILGSEEVSKISLGVSCNEDFLYAAVEWGAEICVFHHGLDVRTDRFIFSKSLQKRLRVIFENNLTIAGYHYALDAHPTIGNNAQIASKLGAKIVDTLFEDWGFVATLKQPKSLKILKEECEALFAHDILVMGDLDRQIEHLGIVSGAGKPYAAHLKEMHEKDVGLFISGESSESVPYNMQDEGIAYFACGHYATETFGVTALGEQLRSKLNKEIDIKFIDIPNVV